MSRLVKKHGGIRQRLRPDSEQPNGEPHFQEIGKANKPVVAALIASIDTPCGKIKPMTSSSPPPPPPPPPHTTNAAALPLADLEEQIQKHVQSYLQSASKVTTSAPNFIRSLVNAHNGVFAGIPSSRRVGRRSVTGNKDSATVDMAERQGDECGQTHYISSVDFFRVLSSKKGIINYSRRVSQLVLSAIRSFLAQRYSDSLEHTVKSFQADLGTLHDSRDDLQTEWEELQGEQKLFTSPEREELVRSLGYFTKSDPLRESAVKTCLCSVGYRLHNSNPFHDSEREDGSDGNHHPDRDEQQDDKDGENNAEDLDREKAPCSHKVISPCFSQRHKWTSNKQNVNKERRVIPKETGSQSRRSLVSEFSLGEIGIHWLLRALLLHECTSRNTIDGIFLSRFLAITSVDDHANIVHKRKFHEAHEIAPYPSAIAYAMKCCGVVEKCRNLTDWMSTLSLGLQRDVKPQCAPPNWLLTHQQVSRCFSVSHNTAASYLYGISGAVQACARANSDVLVRFLECAKPGPQHKHCALVHGKECSIQDFGRAVQSWQTKAEAILSQELMLGMELPNGFQNVTELLHDDLQESARGHWFLKTPGNASGEMKTTKALVSQWSQAVFKHIYNDQKLRAQFFGTSPTVHRSNAAARKSGIQSSHPTHIKGLAMRPERLQKYLNACQNLKRYLLSALHVTGGGPARSTEMGYLLKNSAKSRRNVFLMQGELMFLARYNKRDAMKKSGSAIARFPDKRTSEIFLKYFIFVRTLEELFVYSLHGPEIAKRHESALFATTGKPYSDERFRDEIVQCFQEDGIPFTFQEFRHWRIGTARRLLSKEVLQQVMYSEIQEFEEHNTVTVSRHLGQVPRNPFETIQATELDHDGDHDEFADKTSHLLPHRTPDIRNFPFPVDVSDSFPIHGQSGHSNATANRHYGISASDMNGSGLTDIQKFRMTSRAWHKLLRSNRDVPCVSPNQMHSLKTDPRNGKTLAQTARQRGEDMLGKRLGSGNADLNGNGKKKTMKRHRQTFKYSLPSLPSSGAENSIEEEQDLKKRKRFSPSMLKNQQVQRSTPPTTTHHGCENEGKNMAWYMTDVHRRSAAHSILHLRQRDVTHI